MARSALSQAIRAENRRRAHSLTWEVLSLSWAAFVAKSGGRKITRSDRGRFHFWTFMVKIMEELKQEAMSELQQLGIDPARVVMLQAERRRPSAPWQERPATQTAASEDHARQRIIAEAMQPDTPGSLMTYAAVKR